MQSLYDERSKPETIYKPKCKRLCPKKKKVTKLPKFSTQKGFSVSTNNLNLDKISIEEINQDFLRYSQNAENEKCQNELRNLMIEDNNKYNNNIINNDIIKRPQNPFEKNIELYGEKNMLNKINESSNKIITNYNYF